MPDKIQLVDSPERIAFDLMLEISHFESEKQVEKTREYWLKLYSECLHTVRRPREQNSKYGIR